jgi:hypothetical protein
VLPFLRSQVRPGPGTGVPNLFGAISFQGRTCHPATALTAAAKGPTRSSSRATCSAPHLLPPGGRNAALVQPRCNGPQ